MRKRGFMHFATVGFFIVLIVVTLVGHATWSRYHRTLEEVEKAKGFSLLALAASVQNDVQRLARYAVYEALWSVCERADDYLDDTARVAAIEKLAVEYFTERMTDLTRMYEGHDSRIKLEVTGCKPSFKLLPAENGYALAKVEFARPIDISVDSPDNEMKLTLTCNEFEVMIDCRYFLLQESMLRFIEGIEKVSSNWRWAEYAIAWGQALTGQVKLDGERSKLLFELAWRNHELNTFGSFDRFAMLGSIQLLSSSAAMLLQMDRGIEISITVADVEAMMKYLDRALDMLEAAEVDLRKVGLLIQQVTVIIRNYVYLENSEREALLLKEVDKKLGEALWRLDEVRNHVRGIDDEFKRLVEFVKNRSDPISASLYRGMTSTKENRPPLSQRISSCLKRVEDKVEVMASQIHSCRQQLRADLVDIEHSLARLCSYIESCLQGLLATPYTAASIMNESDEAISALRTTLEGARRDLEEVYGIARNIEQQRGTRMREEVSLASGNLDVQFMWVLDGMDREWAYEIAPPPPVHELPGISVFHEFDVRHVKYTRQDPLGLINARAPPTPIHLYFLNMTLYWAQWEVTLELEAKPIEKIFDFYNPVLPRPLFEHSKGLAFLHKPLGYRYEVPHEKFSFILLIVSPLPFDVA
jgi:hypothetical protein